MKLITMINLMLEGMGGTCAIFFPLYCTSSVSRLYLAPWQTSQGT